MADEDGDRDARTPPPPDGSEAASGGPDQPSDGREPSTAPEPVASSEPARPEGTPITQQVGRAVLIIAAILFGIFAIANSQYVDFNWVFGKTEVTQVGGERTGGGVPLIVLLLAAFALGALIAWIATVRSERRKRDRPDARKRGGARSDERDQSG